MVTVSESLTSDKTGSVKVLGVTLSVRRNPKTGWVFTTSKERVAMTKTGVEGGGRGVEWGGRGNAWRGNAWRGNAWRGNAWRGNAWR